MKRIIFKLRLSAWLNNLPKYAMFSIVMFVLGFSTTFNADHKNLVTR